MNPAAEELTQPKPMRQHPRVAADFVVRLVAGTRSVLARAVDLSLAGLALHDPAGGLEEGAFDRVALKIPGEARQLSLPVRFARRHHDRVALSFAALDWDDLFSLARYLSPRL
jgi:hypothetical protein